MPSADPTDPSDPLLAALLSNILHNTFPDSDTLSATPLTPPLLTKIHSTLAASITTLTTHLASTTHSHEPTISAFIAHGEAVQRDIEYTEASSNKLLLLHRNLGDARRRGRDARLRGELLRREIRFGGQLGGVLGRLGVIWRTVGEAAGRIEGGDVVGGMALVAEAEGAVGRLFDEGGGVGGAGSGSGSGESAVVVGLVRERLAGLRREVGEVVERGWEGLVMGGREEREGGVGGWVKVEREVIVSEGVVISGETLVEALESLGLLKAKIDGLHQLIDGALVRPRLEVPRNMEHVPAFTVDVGTSTVYISGRSRDLSAARLFSDIRILIDFFHDKLPKALQKPFSRIFIPSLNEKLISTYLPTTIPSALSALPQYQDVLRKTTEFERYLQSIQWTLELDLQDWVDRAAKVWLAKRREDALDAARGRFVVGKVKETRRVERSETKEVVRSTEKGSDDSWDQNWSDDEGVAAGQEADADNNNNRQEKGVMTEGIVEEAKKGLSLMLTDDLEDASGWGLDEDLDLEGEEEGAEASTTTTTAAASGEEGGAERKDTPAEEEAEEEEEELEWGEWGEDLQVDDSTGGPQEEEGGQQPRSPLLKRSHSRKKSIQKAPPPPPVVATAAAAAAKSDQAAAAVQKHKRRKSAAGARELTLKETYTVTGMPDSVIEIIENLLDEAEQLSTNPRYTSTPIAPAAHHLLSLPALVLAAYRALAPIYYSTDLASKMFLYNDCLRIEERLLEIQTTRARSPASVFKSLNLEKEAAVIAAFGKRWYSKELESQRLILRDYLDFTQGLVACTEYPQSHECAKAITSVIDRFHTLHTFWQPVLSQSVLFQSLGSLLSTVCTKIVNDIEDMQDISDEESRVLAGFLGRVAELEGLFPGEGGEGEGGGEAVPVTAVYCASWLKFRYMENILECSMVDLMYLYNERQLVDFEREELVDLVKALFADTENRRRCVEEIRRGPKKL